MDGSDLVSWKIFILGLFIVGCYGDYSSEEKGSNSLLCYECNSMFDPRCGLEFDNYTIAFVDCSQKPRLEHLPNEVPSVCRKSIQRVQGTIRVIRSCGYITDDDHDDKNCFIKTGTHEVHITHCSCTKNYCNTGHVGYDTPAILVLFFIFAALLRIK